MNESNKTIQELKESIADKIKNYHSHLNEGPYDVDHVDRWICQFPEEERWSVLAETNRLLETNYIDQLVVLFKMNLQKSCERAKNPYSLTKAKNQKINSLIFPMSQVSRKILFKAMQRLYARILFTRRVHNP